MTFQPDTAELAPSQDPDRYRARPMLSRSFWGMMGFALVCIGAAVAIVVIAPRLTGVRGVHGAPAAPTPIASAVAGPVVSPGPLAAVPVASGLEGRVQKLEQEQARILAAADAALAVAAISEAAAGPRPFATQVAAYLGPIAASADAQALFALAAQGAPSRSELSAQLDAMAAKAARTAHRPGKSASILARWSYLLSSVISIRRVEATGDGPDATLARSQALATGGDLEGALALIDRVAGSGEAPLATWRDAARHRIDIDRHVAGLRALALADLAAARTAVGSAAP